jgi:hypothetical protein
MVNNNWCVVMYLIGVMTLIQFSSQSNNVKVQTVVSEDYIISNTSNFFSLPYRTNSHTKVIEHLGVKIQVLVKIVLLIMYTIALVTMCTGLLY